MQLMLTVIVVLQILTALVMIGLVLIQHGKGADMGASFGSGASGSLFGATGSANFLSRSTGVCAAVFQDAGLGLDEARTSTGPAARCGHFRLECVKALACSASPVATSSPEVPGKSGACA